MFEAYDVAFGIFDHLKQAQSDNAQTNPDLKRPLASVALHPAEAWAGPGKQLETVLKGFEANNVAATFNLSIIDFLNLPVEYAELIMRICKNSVKRKSAQVDEQQAHLEATLASQTKK